MAKEIEAIFVTKYEPEGEVKCKCVVDLDEGLVKSFGDEISRTPQGFDADKAFGVYKEYIKLNDGAKITACPSETYNNALIDMTEDAAKKAIDDYGNGIVVYDA